MTNQVASGAVAGNPLLLDAYLDGELDVFNSLAVGQEISADPSLRAEFEQLAALSLAIREKLPQEPVPASALHAIEAATGKTAVLTGPSWRALAASIFLALLVGGASTWLLLRPPADDRLAEAVLDSHMRALLSGQVAAVTSTDRHTVKPWFNGRLVQSPQVVDLSKDGFPLIGGRVDVINTQPAATLIYGRRAHLISLSAIPSTDAKSNIAARGSIKGINLVGWSDGQTKYLAASDLNPAELAEFARLFAAVTGK